MRPPTKYYFSVARPVILTEFEKVQSSVCLHSTAGDIRLTHVQLGCLFLPLKSKLSMPKHQKRFRLTCHNQNTSGSEGKICRIIALLG